MTTDEIIAEGATRRAEAERLHAYDPATGEGSPLARFALPITDEATWHVPEAMGAFSPGGDSVTLLDLAAEGTSFEAWCQAEGRDFDVGVEDLSVARLFFDFEFFCYVCVTIEQRDGTLGPLVLTLPQRRAMARREAQRAAGLPIRQIEVKHRRYGSTTEKSIYLFWLQRFLARKKRLGAYMISLEQGGAAKIARRLEITAAHEPGFLRARGLSTTLGAVRNAPTSRLIRETGAMVSIASVNNPQAPSGDTAQLVLISEAGKMASTQHASAERLITNITSIVPYEPSSALIVESTAEQVGRWFRREVERARRAEQGAEPSAYELHFTCWLDDPVCTAPLSGALAERGSLGRWIDTWRSPQTEQQRYMLELWGRGASLEQIRWWEVEARQKPTLWAMKQENPTTIEEAFQTGGQRIFPVEHVEAARSACLPPLRRGRLVAEGLIGPAALRNVRFVDDDAGPLLVWREPGETYSGALPRKVLRRYVVGADPNAGMSEGADNGVGKVLDRAPTLLGSGVEVVAEWVGKVETRQFAWEMARLARYYEDAQLVVEVNTLIEDAETGHDPSLTVLDEILPHYRNVYHRRVRDADGQDFMQKAGYYMGRAEKLLAVSALQRGLRVYYESLGSGHRESEEDYLAYAERSEEACREMDLFQQHDDGSMGATPKSIRSDPHLKDDRVIAAAIAKQISDEMPPCEMVAPLRRVVPQKAAMARF